MNNRKWVKTVIELKRVSKTYNKTDMIVNDLDLKIKSGELAVLVGESGCGKTTTMKMINRLIEPTSGTIEINGQDIKEIDAIELRRNIGYVIQKVGLFPHLTVGQNVGIVPRLTKKEGKLIAQRTVELLDMVGLQPEEYLNRYPNELSGGQQQRIGVARALANDPDIVLMDEPFSALDPITREQLQNELLKLQDELHKTIVFVTHDIDEAIKIGDRIAVMQHGKIVQFDTPEQVLKQPANEFIEQFVGRDRLWKTPDMLHARDIMNENYFRVGMNRSLAHAAALMREKNCGTLVVVSSSGKTSNYMQGIVSKRQLAKNYEDDVRIKDIMKTDVETVHPDAPLSEVLMLLGKERALRFVPVVEDGVAVGIVTEMNMLSVLTDIIPGSEGVH